MIEAGVETDATKPLAVPLGRVSRGMFALSQDAQISLIIIAHPAAIIVAAVLAKLLYVDLVLGQTQDLLPYVLPAIPLSLTLYGFLRQMGLFDVSAMLEPRLAYGKILGAHTLSFLVLLGGLYLLKAADFYSRGWLLSWLALDVIGLVWLRWAAMSRLRQWHASGRLTRRLAIYGDAKHVAIVHDSVQRQCPQMQISGVYLTPGPAKAGGVACGGGLPELREAMQRGSFDEVVICLPAEDAAGIHAATRGLVSFSTELLLCTDLKQFPVSTHGSREIAGFRAEILSPVPPAVSDWRMKRLLDYVIALPALILLAPVLALVAIAIKLDTPGPVFFRQRRYGQNNSIFRIFKFRTMTVTEDGANVKQAERNDPRVTRVGTLLRSTSIDELPQLFNVLSGDMSIVGPRPHALSHDDGFERELDLFASRRRVVPGITGWAQVNGCRGETRTIHDVRRRTEHDLYYIQNWSIWFDIEITLRTVVTVLRGAY